MTIRALYPKSSFVLTIKKLTKVLGGRTLFEEADMTINWGERVALVGANGAGKSTLFKIILDQEPADSGSIDKDEYAIIGYLSQEAGDPGDETIMEIAMGITPELAQAMRTMREYEALRKLDDPIYHKAQDVFDASNGYQLEPKAKKNPLGIGLSPRSMGYASQDIFWRLDYALSPRTTPCPRA